MIDPNRAIRAFLPAAFAAAISFAAAILVGTGAYAHDWYPRECCAGQDCAPVESSVYVAGAAYGPMGEPIANPLPHLQVTSKLGTAVIPDYLPRRASPDGRMHVCMRQIGAYMHVFCLFVPPAL